MFIAGHIWLNNKSAMVDDLNVFPVPDGDTGTNMCFALKSAVDELQKIKDIEKITAGEISKIIAESSLMGARGNSGIILSQYFYGLSCKIDSNKEISISEFAEAMHEGSNYAYKSVSKPVEGTILTVMREMSQTAIEFKDKSTDFAALFEEVLRKGKIALNKTPDMLPVLKEAGVVDAGGCGFILIIEGMLRSLKGRSLKEEENTEKNIPVLIKIWEKFLNLAGKEDGGDTVLISETKTIRKGLKKKIKTMIGGISTSSVNSPLRPIYKTLRKLRFNSMDGLTSTGQKMVDAWKEKPDERYCLSFMLKGEGFSGGNVSDRLKDLGSSIVAAGTDDLTKIHIHTNEPLKIIEDLSQIGGISKIKIDDMHQQQTDFLSDEQKDGKSNKVGVIAVASGRGWKEVFKSSGVSHIVECWRTMNPSVKEILRAIEKVDSFNIILLPNDSNVLLSAEQAARISDKNIEIIESKTMPEGISSLLSFNPELGLKENIEEMTESLNMVRTGMAAKAVRPVNNGDFAVQRGDYIGIIKKKIAVKGNDCQETALDMVKKLVKDDSDLITIYWGRGCSKNMAEDFEQKVISEFPGNEIQSYYGGQYHYYYIVSVE